MLMGCAFLPGFPKRESHPRVESELRDSTNLITGGSGSILEQIWTVTEKEKQNNIP
jgi:hypothetical protein